ncbi:MAG: RES family NAD+ phosphorylase [Ectothiorhodospiraceae bacterium]|nr:RES family NAD+ phosphorylase [Chromatiales bacterium]MCP5154406.1 RES family NAD+ phosphorylase [Ectothiorhodospiraceae bacterium]
MARPCSRSTCTPTPCQSAPGILSRRPSSRWHPLTAVDIWARCADDARPGPVSGELVRLVESQEQVATTFLVDDLDEQALLEELLERSKPPTPATCEGLHYLLSTPFRYPPLRHGSRFGSRFEPSLLYGSTVVETALAEGAYYRLLFWTGMAIPPPSGRLLTQHTALRVPYSSVRGLRLQEPPFREHEAVLRDRVHYAATQRLGTAMREAGVELFEFVSARAPGRGINVALFRPSGLAARVPRHQQPWLCDTRADTVTFSSSAAHGPSPLGATPRVLRFGLDQFLVDGALPRPAT